ncbi:MAG: bifunctional phosphoribosylaminoimidazolecarboxamide formyltransferase/IMP cyclohydrolase [Bdellovibrionales bacterium]|nr:bifunctional phosphoribosylaminoimidazolecarboxamide formyltransferase/IMP cyclohydrolase [Bdellovibrionales bacterium]
MADRYPIKKALLSVSDKTGLKQLCTALCSAGVALYSTRGTAAFLQEAGLAVSAVEDLTQFPEMMDGRVKTLHPRIFGGVLARREMESDIEEAKAHNVPLFDLVVVNLYPFHEYLDADDSKQASHVDIGGPSLIRAASKNFRSVTILSDPNEYSGFLAEFKSQQGATRLAYRKACAARSFGRTSAYDSMIASTWQDVDALPSTLSLVPQQALRYGENPHQKAVWCGRADWKLLQGKELSYNNLLDIEAAWRIAAEHKLPTVAIVKHNNPCGVASGQEKVEQIFNNALECDPKSAFGGIIASTVPINRAAAEGMTEFFAEAVLAPAFDADALEIFAKKKNLRVLEWGKPISTKVDIRPALGGWLLQETDPVGLADEEEWQTVTEQKVPDAVMEDLRFAWLVCKHVRSNAIVIGRTLSTLGIGAGQMSRVDAVELALRKCDGPTEGAVLASDAFFPFRDNIDLLRGRGIRAVIQPGGSKRDAEVIEACNELGIAMVFTGRRHFRH